MGICDLYIESRVNLGALSVVPVERGHVVAKHFMKGEETTEEWQAFQIPDTGDSLPLNLQIGVILVKITHVCPFLCYESIGHTSRICNLIGHLFVADR